MILYFILVALVGYLCGNYVSGYIVGKVSGLDIRDYGSGNAGTTNVLRVLGKSKALFTFLGDTLKGIIPMLVVKYLLCPAVPALSDEPVKSLIVLFTGFAVVMGHDYPFVLKFKGGKGIATSVAVMLTFDWRMGLISALIFLICVAITRYVSLGSCLLSAAFPIEMLIFHFGRWDLFALSLLFAFFAIYRHRANIKRLMNGTESKLGQKVDVKK